MTKQIGEIGFTCGKDERELYQGAVMRLVSKAYEERAVFPLRVAVTNGQGETWNVAVTIKGDEIVFKHSSGDFWLTFPMRLVVTDSRNDIVASMDVSLVDVPLKNFSNN